MISYYFGSIGSGKTTIATAIALENQENKKYKHILSNFETKSNLTQRVQWEDIGFYDLQDCLILLDESQIFADCRDFKKFGKEKTNFLALSRHYKCDFVFFSQSWGDSDKKIRSLATHLYFVQKGLILPIVKSKRVFKEIIVDELTHDIVEGYRFASFKETVLFTLFPSKLGRICKRYYAPKYWQYFDSYSKPLELKDFDYQYWSENFETYSA